MLFLTSVPKLPGVIITDPTPHSTAEPMDWSPYVAGLLGFLLAVALVVIVFMAIKIHRLSKRRRRR